MTPTVHRLRHRLLGNEQTFQTKANLWPRPKSRDKFETGFRFDVTHLECGRSILFVNAAMVFRISA